MIKIHNGQDYNADPVYEKQVILEIDVDAVTLATGATSAAAVAAGGSLADDTYYYAVSAIKLGRETAVGGEVNATTSGANNSVKITITPVAYAEKYRIYKGIASGVYNTYFETTGLIFVDNGQREFSFGTNKVNISASEQIASIRKDEIKNVYSTWIAANGISPERAILHIECSEECKYSLDLSQISNQPTWTTTEAGLLQAVKDVLSWV